MLSCPSKVRMNSLRLLSISNSTLADRSMSGSDVRPPASRRSPPDNSMKKDCAGAMSRNVLVVAADALPAESRHAPAARVMVTRPGVNVPVKAKRKTLDVP